MNQNLAPPVNVIPGPATIKITGHFGELAQGRLGPDGPVALITLPCPVLVTEVGYDPAPGPLRTAEPVSRKACTAARLALAEIGAADWGGALNIVRPAPPGLGLGSSTAETLGAIRAVARVFGARFAPEREAALCFAVDGAIDPLMINGPVLFASRKGQVIERLAPLPPMRIIGGTAGPSQPTDPGDNGFPDMTSIFAEIATASCDGNLTALADAAERSAEANQRRNPNPAWTAIRALKHRHGALGVVVSHTGPVIGLILPLDSHSGGLTAALTGLGLKVVLDYRLPGD